MHIENKKILTPKDIQEELGVSISLIYRELKSGRIPSVKIGDRYFIGRKRWDEFINGENNQQS
jgi:excisionase family DNA binding protein